MAQLRHKNRFALAPRCAAGRFSGSVVLRNIADGGEAEDNSFINQPGSAYKTDLMMQGTAVFKAPPGTSDTSERTFAENTS